MADPAASSALFRRLDRELWVVTAAAGGRRGGLVATTVVQASIVAEAPRVMVTLAHQHHTWGLVRDAGAFGLHLLGEGQLDWVWRFGLGSGRDVDKLDSLETRPGASGAPLLVEAAGWLDCRVEAHFDTGDRAIVLAEVFDARAPGPGPILTVHRMLERATPERRAALAEHLRRDAEVDALAIRRWRQRVSPRPSGE
jgi:flavin reductase (DIM6/NTAB) family NADH-FMN oxidoreductase RutF